jgi:phosphoglycolate phosphatase-like HAD superfamily hydrolase/SAM-dependent methyltransferase
VKTRLVLFDIDGTLIRTGGAGVKAFAQTAAHLFGRAGGTKSMHFHGRTDVSLVREFLRNSALPDSDANLRQFLEAYVHFLDHQLELHRGEICPGVRELLGALRSHPAAPVIGLLTGNVRLGARLKLSAHGLTEDFELGAFGDDHENRNELARIALERGSERLGRPLRGEQVVVIGDTRADIECARAIGARCVAVATGGESLSSLLEHSPTMGVESLLGVSAARVISAGAREEHPIDWDTLYQTGDTRWDKGEPAPGLVDFLSLHPEVAGQRVLVPGCGRGNDVRAWAESGCDVVGLDVSPRAIEEAASRLGADPRIRLLVADFLSKPENFGQFDWVFEHTLWCAIPPSKRKEYVESVAAVLPSGGRYLSLNYLQPADEAGPPFGVTVAELRSWFSGRFELLGDWLPRSFVGRAGRERMFLWRRRS